MRDETLIEPFAVPEYFVDGFIDHEVSEGVMTCVAYRSQPSPNPDAEPLKVIQFKVVMRLNDATESNERTALALKGHRGDVAAVPHLVKHN